LGKPVPACQTILDCPAARVDGGGGAANGNSSQITTTRIPTLTVYRPDALPATPNQLSQSKVVNKTTLPLSVLTDIFQVNLG